MRSARSAERTIKCLVAIAVIRSHIVPRQGGHIQISKQKTGLSIQPIARSHAAVVGTGVTPATDMATVAISSGVVCTSSQSAHETTDAINSHHYGILKSYVVKTEKHTHKLLRHTYIRDSNVRHLQWQICTVEFLLIFLLGC